MIIQGNALHISLPDESVDSIVTDPPYELGFMGKDWDKSGVTYRVETWLEAFRVLKPGGHLLAFGGSRTYHRMVCAVEDAGFEIRDQLLWMFGQGFPKSKDVSKSIDKEAGAEREIIDRVRIRHERPRTQADSLTLVGGGLPGQSKAWMPPDISIPVTDEAKEWEGWGTGLKPAHEPIVLARKPLSEKTVASNVLEHGTGGLNVDGCRIGTKDVLDGGAYSSEGDREPTSYFLDSTGKEHEQPLGRWPANVVLSHSEGCVEIGTKRMRAGYSVAEESTPSRIKGGLGGKHSRHYADPDGMETIEAWECVSDCAVAMLDEQSGDRRSGGIYKQSIITEPKGRGSFFGGPIVMNERDTMYNDSGGASRFFYTAKASRGERETGLKSLPYRTAGEATGGRKEGSAGLDSPRAGASRTDGARNHHPTVKPIELMRWLTRLVTPPGGIVLDPFGGSGTTACAAVLENFSCIMIDNEWSYCEIARLRFIYWSKVAEEERRQIPLFIAPDEKPIMQVGMGL